MTKNEYNDIPVFYCGGCLSLRIMGDDMTGDYCPDCGSVDVRECHISEWEKMVASRKARNNNQKYYGEDRKKGE